MKNPSDSKAAIKRFAKKEDAPTLRSRITEALNPRRLGLDLSFPDEGMRVSAVMLLLGEMTVGNEGLQPCLILNKRSRRVRQPGDLCLPGGGLTPGLDPALSRLLALPFSPLKRWPFWPLLQNEIHRKDRRLALMLAASLREGFEEMRLNPLAVRFLGPLPPERLRLFRSVIFPMTGWVCGQKRFFPNWEVEAVVPVPIQHLLDPDAYAVLEIHYSADIQKRYGKEREFFPCMIHYVNGRRELLWGATFRIVMGFLHTVFGFRPPQSDNLPVIERIIDSAYLTGHDR